METSGPPPSTTIPSDWEHISPEWMSVALRSIHPDVRVTDVALLMRDDGTNRRARRRPHLFRAHRSEGRVLESRGRTPAAALSQRQPVQRVRACSPAGFRYTSIIQLSTTW